ncbi:unnamed protein product [Dibothriocephalus latus]|uniref:PDZ domain-containing protein n=1 Tax=Dibothriocephalus latus TaxID=60516 RepID=A0A3P7LLC5_DIBLA|nr:unnamed protein product [Dibothriocephalus latus]
MTSSTVVGATLPGEFLVRLRRQSGGLGFKLLGGAEEGTPLLLFVRIRARAGDLLDTLSIGPLVPGGVAEKSGMIQTGDHLVSVNGERVVGARHRWVVQLLEQNAACTHSEVVLGLWRPTETAQKLWPPPSGLRQHSDGGFPADQSSSASSASSSVVSGARQCYSSLLILLFLAGSGGNCGNIIIARRSCQRIHFPLLSHAARLVPGSPADRSRQLQVGDLILSINGVNIAGLRREDIVRLIRDSGCQVALSVLSHSSCKFIMPSGL